MGALGTASKHCLSRYHQTEYWQKPQLHSIGVICWSHPTHGYHCRNNKHNNKVAWVNWPDQLTIQISLKHSTLGRLILLCNFVSASQGNIYIRKIVFIAQEILYKSTVIHEQSHTFVILQQINTYYCSDNKIQHRAGETSQPELIGNFTCWATDRCWFRQLRFLIQGAYFCYATIRLKWSSHVTRAHIDPEGDATANNNDNNNHSIKQGEASHFRGQQMEAHRWHGCGNQCLLIVF